MDTFFRDLLHEKVSRKISVKAPKKDGEFFVAVLPPDKHPSSCESKDFFWMKASGKHTVRQLKEIYQEKKNLQIKFSDGDKTIGDSSRISSLNHFGDEVIVVWAQESVSTLPSVSADEIGSPLPASRTSEPPADAGLEGSVSPAKRRTESPSVSVSRKKQRDASPREDIRQFFKPKLDQAKTESKSESLSQNRLAENASNLHDNAIDNVASAPALSPSVSESEAAPQSSHLSVSASPRNGISQNSSPRTPEDAVFKRREQTVPLPDAALKQESQTLSRSKSISDLLEVDNSINTTIRLHSQLPRPE